MWFAWLETKAGALGKLMESILEVRPENSFVVKIGKTVMHFNTDCFRHELHDGSEHPLFKSEGG